MRLKPAMGGTRGPIVSGVRCACVQRALADEGREQEGWRGTQSAAASLTMMRSEGGLNERQESVDIIRVVAAAPLDVEASERLDGGVEGGP